MGEASSPGQHRPLAESLKEYGRGATGGLLFSLPLIYTMEVWWTGFIISPGRLFGYVVVVFVLLLGYNRYCGIRRDTNWGEIACDSVEEMGLGLLIATLMLYLIGQIGSTTPTSTVVGRVVLEGMITAIGVSIGTSQLGGSSGDQGRQVGGDGGGGAGAQPRPPTRLLGQLVLAFCGAIVFASNVAPTEEVILIAADAGPWKLLALSALAIALAMGVLYYFNFITASRHVGKRQFIAALGGATVAYTAGLAASALMLYVFDRYAGVSWSTGVARTVALGFLGTLGAAVGRLLLND